MGNRRASLRAQPGGFSVLPEASWKEGHPWEGPGLLSPAARLGVPQPPAQVPASLPLQLFRPTSCGGFLHTLTQNPARPAFQGWAAAPHAGAPRSSTPEPEPQPSHESPAAGERACVTLSQVSDSLGLRVLIRHTGTPAGRTGHDGE